MAAFFVPAEEAFFLAFVPVVFGIGSLGRGLSRTGKQRPVLLTNCLPLLDPLFFFSFVAAFWSSDKFSHAFSGRYRVVPPFRSAFFPSAVVHFSSPHVWRLLL